jgi:hypothetical protein
MSASITVSSNTAGVICPRFAGLSYDKLSMTLPRFTLENAELIGMFRTLGRSLLRIGGNSVDLMHWTPDGAGQTSGQIAPSDIDALAAFLDATGWTALYSVNLATSTPAAAAAEAAYAAKSLGSSLYGIEFGNEPNQYGAAGYFPRPPGLSRRSRRSGSNSAKPPCKPRRASRSPVRPWSGMSAAGRSRLASTSEASRSRC